MEKGWASPSKCFADTQESYPRTNALQGLYETPSIADRNQNLQDAVERWGGMVVWLFYFSTKQPDKKIFCRKAENALYAVKIFRMITLSSE